MKKRRNGQLIGVVLLAIGVFFSGCSQNGEQSAAEPENVTIKVAGGLWIDVLSEFVEKEFPNVTIEYINIDLGWPVDPNKIQEYIAAGDLPDLINFGNPSDIPSFAEYEIIMPLNELLEKNNFDLTRLEPELIPNIQSYANGEDIYAMPVDLATWVLAYNKDIFDQFGVPYPTDNMTWAEVINLARELTQEKDGIQYRGLHPGPHTQLIQQTGFTFVDAETDKPLYQESEGIRKVLDIYMDIINIPGNIPDEDPYGYFFNLGQLGGGEVAMQPQWNTVVHQIQIEEEVGLNWDQVTWPTLGEGYEQTGPSAEGQMIGISPHSKHIDLAYEILDYLLSDNFQADYVRKMAKAPALADNDIIAEIANNETIKESPKNVKALTSLPFKGVVTKRSPYQRYAEGAFLEGMKLILEDDGIDINTALRIMQEKAELAINNAKEINE